ncbi:hypothetical protein B0A52_00567 [Exophiala mesophila]|uniref:asparaginase n=1 Tax=Exophiala mesophila TaxID=212818 RepID=A0A438NHK2_EXOME|nr:hypothetical protein B0A52_00567 [Exophiala mesophila]
MFTTLLLTSLALSVAASPLPAPVPLPEPHLNQLVARQDIQSPINASLPNVTIFATGGTIASQGTSNTQTVGYSVGLGVQQLVDAVPEILNISNIRGYQIANVGSPSINQTILLRLAQAITEELARDDIAGVVVTHGTDTLEETAYFLDLAVNTTKPIIVVGAMRPATALSADGPLNLLQAVTLAASPNAIGRGAMITLNDRIGSAYYTTKNSANSLDTFYSTEMGQLGFFINQVPYFYYEPAVPIGKVHFDLTGAESLPLINILYSHQDMDPQLFNSSVENGADGLVVAGSGAGSLSGVAYIAAEAVYNETGIPIVSSHRSPDGFVPASPDEFIIASGFLNPQKSRVLLQLALQAGFDVDSIRDLFALGYPPP